MRTKAIIMRPDRTNDVVRLTSKKIKDGRFSHRQHSYIVDANRFQLTTEPFLLFFNRTYSTFYFREGFVKPLPVPHFEGEDGVPEDLLHMTAGELEALFTEWFYRTIAPSQLSKWERVQLLLTAGTAAGLVYLIYLVSDLLETLRTAGIGA
jgi:hypothetical protein